MEKLTPERVREILRAKKCEISVQQATQILEFMKILARSVIGRHLNNN